MPVQSIDQRVGDDKIERVRFGNAGGLSHAVPQNLAAAELALVAVDGVIALHLRDQVRVAKPDRDRRWWVRRCRRNAAAASGSS